MPFRVQLKFPACYANGLLVLILFLTSCSESNTSKQKPWKYTEEIRIENFNSNQISNDVTISDAELNLNNDGPDGSATINFKRDEKFSGIEFSKEQGWNLNPSKSYCLVFEAKSKDESTFLTADVSNDKGKTIRRIVNIHKDQWNTYYFELNPSKTALESGLRDTPKPWVTSAIPMKINGLLSDQDFSTIKSIKLFRIQGLKDKSIEIDNIRILDSPEPSKDFLTGIVDQYGQNVKVDFPIKVYSDAQLKTIADQELADLEAYDLMPDRSSYGGWKEGPKFEGTGFFTTRKHKGKWALVDPDGYLFFSIGIANVRMANSTTYTGRDYAVDSIKYRDPEDVTPEDSKGIIDIPNEIRTTATVSNPLRNNMFLELPDYNDALANHYSYRKESHFGPIEHGETFSFYRANLERRYGEEYPNSFYDKWLEVTEKRMKHWGFTSYGNWIDTSFYARNKVPYFANGWIIGDFQKVYSGTDYWGPMPDPFDPEFERRALKSIKTVSEEVQNNPWCIGVFIDNEKSWGREGSLQQHYGLVFDGLNKGTESYVKNRFTEILRRQYSDIEELNTNWKTRFTSWEDFNTQKIAFSPIPETELFKRDLSVLLEAFATQYFKIVHQSLEQEMPNHLYMGCRFAVWGITPEVRRAAAKYVDVFSYNYYKEGVGEKYWEFLAEVDMPTIIGEYHMGAPDSGLFHSGLVHAQDQSDRAEMWEDYAHSVIDNPYLVGAHWFQYLDSPITGRAHDGENYNVGFVSTTDIPYPEMVTKAKEVNSKLYPRRFNSTEEQE